MATITPHWQNDVSVISKQLLNRGDVVSGTLDLSNKLGALMFLSVGRTSAFALTNGANVRTFRNFNTSTYSNTVTTYSGTLGITIATITAVNGDSSSGQRQIAVQSTVGFAAGDLICIRDVALTRLEWGIIVGKTSSTLILAKPLKYTHLASNGDFITNKAESQLISVNGGAPCEINIDYADDVSGDSLVVEVIAQVHDYDTSV